MTERGLDDLLRERVLAGRAPVKDDRVYLKHILRCVSRIEEYAVGGRDSGIAPDGPVPVEEGPMVNAGR